MVPEYIDELIEALIDKNTPFVRGTCFPKYTSSPLDQILASASPHAKISEQLAKRIKSSSLGILTTWSPQQFILNHSVFYFTCSRSIP